MPTVTGTITRPGTTIPVPAVVVQAIHADGTVIAVSAPTDISGNYTLTFPTQTVPVTIQPRNYTDPYDTIYTVSIPGGPIFQVNPDTGQAVAIGNFGTPGYTNGLAYSKTSRDLYAIYSDNFPGTMVSLYRFDTITGVVSGPFPIANASAGQWPVVTGAISPIDGKYYVMTSGSQLFRIDGKDTSTPTAVLIGTMAGVGFFNAGDAAFRSDGTLYVAEGNGEISSVDLVTAATTPVVTSTLSFPYMLAWDETNTRWISAQGSGGSDAFRAVDPTTGATTNLATSGSSSQIYDSASWSIPIVDWLLIVPTDNVIPAGTSGTVVQPFDVQFGLLRCRCLCTPGPVQASCSIPAATMNDAQLLALCNVTAGPVTNFAMTEVGKTYLHNDIDCAQSHTTNLATVNLTGLVPNSLLVATVTWSDISNTPNGPGCDPLGNDTISSGVTGPIGPQSKINNQVGFDYWIPSMATSTYWAPTTGAGNGTWTFQFTGGLLPASGMYQIQVFQLTGQNLNLTTPFSEVKTASVNNTQPGGSMGGVFFSDTMTFAASPNPIVFLAGSRHGDWPGAFGDMTRDGFRESPVGAGTVTEVATWQPVLTDDSCQTGQVGGFMTGGNVLKVESAMNWNWQGNIQGQSVWTGLRLNSGSSVNGGTQTVGQCCQSVTNGPCNGTQNVTMTVTEPANVSITAAPGSHFVVRLKVNGTIVDQVVANNTAGAANLTVSDALSYTGVVQTGLPEGAVSASQCALIEVVCNGYGAGANSITIPATTSTVSVP